MKYFSYIVIGIVTAVIVAGFFVVGSPKEERMRRFDEQRVQNLQYLQGQIIEYWQSKNKLPTDLAFLNDPTRGVIVPTDPETGAEYGYTIKGSESFALCADFAVSSSGVDLYSQSKPLYPISYGPLGQGGDVWSHDAGRICFDRTIDKDFFKIRKPVD